MKKQLSILLLEDDWMDAELLTKSLVRSGMDFNSTIVSSKAEFLNAIKERAFDAILADHSLPQFSSIEALEMVIERQINTPFILVTGTVSEEFAVTILQHGAEDYILKKNLQRLPSAIYKAIERKDIQKEKEAADKALRLSEQKYRLLFERNPMPMWMVSKATLGIVAVNDVAIEHYGYSREEFLQINSRDLVPPEEWDRYLFFVANPVTGIYHSGIWQHIKKSGELIFVDIIANDFMSENEQVRLVLANDVTEKVKTQEKLITSSQEIQRLASHLQVIREEERTSIAREIHDELGQMLTALKINISMMRSKLPEHEKELRARISDVILMTDNITNTVRQIASKLRPGILDDMGLAAALEWQSREFKKHTGIKCIFSEGYTDTNIDNNVATGLFRIYQEALTNVARHSGATEVTSSLRLLDACIVLTIADNGKGFDPESVKTKKRLGLLGMKERAMIMNAELTIDSMPGEGCVVTVKTKL